MGIVNYKCLFHIFPNPKFNYKKYKINLDKTGQNDYNTLCINKVVQYVNQS